MLSSTSGQSSGANTPLIGRERELAAAMTLLRHPGVRLLSLIGPDGSGKTRLSLALARMLNDDFEDGVVFVPLTALNEPDLIAATIISVLNQRVTSDQPTKEILKTLLAERHMLLVLDGFDGVRRGAPQIADLLAAAPRLKIMVTCREALRIYGEHLYTVPPLSLPDTSQVSQDNLSQYEAVALFMQHAAQVDPEFGFNEINAPAIVQICLKLDGLALAIELAAKQLYYLQPGEILQGILQHLPPQDTHPQTSGQVITPGVRTLTPSPIRRRRPLRVILEWLMGELDDTGALLFQRIGVFAGGFTPESVLAVCSPGLGRGIEAALQELIQRGLVLVLHSEQDSPRFYQPAAIGEYAANRLAERPESEAIRQLHAEHFVSLAEKAERELNGSEQAFWLARLNRELGNLRAALAWTIEKSNSDLALRLASSLWRYWWLSLRSNEGVRWLQKALATGESAPVDVRARSLRAYGNLLGYRKAESNTAHEAALTLYRSIGDQAGIAACLNNLGNIARARKDYQRALQLYEESLVIHQRQNNRFGESVTLGNLAMVAFARGDRTLARQYLELGQQIDRELGDQFSLAYSLYALGGLALVEERMEEADELFREALRLANETGYTPDAVAARIGLARLAIRRNQLVDAARLCQEALQAAEGLEVFFPLMLAVEGYAGLAASRGALVQAATLYGAADTMESLSNLPRDNLESWFFEEGLAVVRAQLPPTIFESAWQEGTSLVATDTERLRTFIAQLV